MTSSAALVDDVRARLEAGASHDEARLLRRRIRRNLVMGTVPPVIFLVSGGFSSLSVGLQLFGGTAWVLAVAFALNRYWRLTHSGPRVIPEEEVLKVAAKSHRCPGCGALVLPADAGECLRCGRIVKPVEALLTVAVFLAVMLGTILWGIYR
jgi:ribosomal protein S27AE